MRNLILISLIFLGTRSYAYETSYPTRLEHLKQLSQKYPGYSSVFGFIYRDQGLWAGNTIQTKWQYESARSQQPIWKWVNYYLTSAPFYFAQDKACVDITLVHQLKHSEEAWPISIEEVCQAWKKFFATSKRTPSLASTEAKRELRALFWSAHESSIQYALWRHEDEMLENRRQLPRKEWNYWANWLGVVEYLQKLNFPTTDSLIYPIVQLTGPQCSPLGAAHCEQMIAADPIRREYTKALGDLDMDLEDVRAGLWDVQVIEVLSLRLFRLALAQTL